MELGEAGAAAAIRECREETGLHVEIVGEFGDSVHRYDHDSVRLSFFDCRPGQAALDAVTAVSLGRAVKLGRLRISGWESRGVGCAHVA